MANTRHSGLKEAKKNKADEWYTQYGDIEKEVNAYLEFNPDLFKDKTILCPCDDPDWSNFTHFFAQHFNDFGLKKLICTSYAQEKKPYKKPMQLSLFETESPDYDPEKTNSCGKVFVLTRKNRRVNLKDLKWKYLKGDGDYHSDEVIEFREESDFIITNPPFSLLTDFIRWINESKKQFLIIAPINSITYSDVFPLIKSNKIWTGTGMGRWISGFIVPPEYPLTGTEAKINSFGQRIVSSNNCLWLTNIDHGRLHRKLELMTMEDNIRYSKHAKIKELGYQKYDNYDAIEVPYYDAIPSDYSGAMGVPITFLNKYNPAQFEIIGATESEGTGFSEGLWDSNSKIKQATINNEKVYKRLFIKARTQV